MENLSIENRTFVEEKMNEFIKQGKIAKKMRQDHVSDEDMKAQWLIMAEIFHSLSDFELEVRRKFPHMNILFDALLTLRNAHIFSTLTAQYQKNNEGNEKHDKQNHNDKSPSNFSPKIFFSCCKQHLPDQSEKCHDRDRNWQKIS